MDYEKIKELENIEEELGIDLITLFKVFKQSRIFVKEAFDLAWGTVQIFGEKPIITDWLQLVKTNDKEEDLDEEYKEYANQWCFNFEYWDYDHDSSIYLVSVKDYGKKWALTKEELDIGGR